jgi:SAM-dependent methyltransferase
MKEDIGFSSALDLHNSCPICRSKELRPHTLEFSLERGRQSITACQDCGYAWRILPSFQENIIVQIQSTESRLVRPNLSLARWPHRLALVAAQVNRLIAKPGNALDIGCSNGLWLYALGDKWKRYGIEPSLSAAEMARQISQADIHAGVFEDYQAPIKEFDLITAFAVIEHLANPRGLVEWAYDHLRAGGLFVIMTGDREAPGAVRLGENWPLYRSPDHASYFSARSIRLLLPQYRFEICREEWRGMIYSGSIIGRILAKLNELMGKSGSPGPDHYYCYARKPVTKRATED